MKKYTKLFMFIIIILAIAMIAYSMEHKNHHVISVTNAIASSIIITEPVVIKEKMIKVDYLLVL